VAGHHDPSGLPCSRLDRIVLVRPHAIVQLRRAPGRPVPHWERFITDKRVAVESFGSDLDAVFRRHRAPVWITAEYPPAGERQRSPEEVASGLDRVVRVIFPDRRRLPAGLIEDVARHPSVAWARPGIIGAAPLPPLATEAGVAVSEWPGQLIGLPFAHAVSKGDPAVTVAVLDTGIDATHPELEGRIAPGKDVVDFEGLETSEFIGDLYDADDRPEDDVGHGTHVAGIIVGRGRRMPEGVSPECRVVPVRVLAAMEHQGRRVGAGLVDNINVGIKWAVDQGADVVNMSLGLRHEHGGLPHAEVIDYALRKGTTVVAAAGNDGTDNKYYPGALPGVIAVGAVDRDGSIAPFSSYGAHISYLAPGTQILSSFRGDGYAASSGTSQAAPFVSGAVALLKSIAHDRRRRLGDHHVKHVLTHTSDRVDHRRHHTQGGYGVVNLTDAVKLLHHELEGQGESR
jgi:thermitase